MLPGTSQTSPWLVPSPPSGLCSDVTFSVSPSETINDPKSSCPPQNISSHPFSPLHTLHVLSINLFVVSLSCQNSKPPLVSHCCVPKPRTQSWHKASVWWVFVKWMNEAWMLAMEQAWLWALCLHHLTKSVLPAPLRGKCCSRCTHFKRIQVLTCVINTRWMGSKSTAVFSPGWRWFLCVFLQPSHRWSCCWNTESAPTGMTKREEFTLEDLDEQKMDFS